jgi:hypothetical protein
MFPMLTVVLALAQPGVTDIADTTRELTRIEQRLAATWKAGDCTGWGAMLAPEWSVIHITGSVISKAEALQLCRAPTVSIEAFDVDEIAVRSFGDTAVVTGQTRVVTGGAAPGQVSLRFTDVFIRKNGQWQGVASQATRLGS